MPSFTITFSDAPERGIVHAKFEIDREHLPEGSPATDALLVGMAVQRMWSNEGLVRLTSLICRDLIIARDQWLADVREKVVKLNRPANTANDDGDSKEPTPPAAA